MYKNANKFFKEFEEVASKFEWYFYTRKYVVKNKEVVIKEVRGVKRGEQREDVREYTPLTAFVEAKTGRYFEMDRFDMAAQAIEMAPDCAVQIIDVCDDWPDRLHGYSPKNFELKMREDLLKVCYS